MEQGRFMTYIASHHQGGQLMEIIALGFKHASPEVFIRNLMDIQTKELFGSVFENVLKEAFRASALVPRQGHISSLSQPAVTEHKTLITSSTATQTNYTIVSSCIIAQSLHLYKNDH